MVPVRFLLNRWLKVGILFPYQCSEVLKQTGNAKNRNYTSYSSLIGSATSTNLHLYRSKQNGLSTWVMDGLER